ncbi:hypothetical protein [Dactylosporangium sp. CS-033363]
MLVRAVWWCRALLGVAVPGPGVDLLNGAAVQEAVVLCPLAVAVVERA